MKVSAHGRWPVLPFILSLTCLLICLGLPTYAQGRYSNARDLVARTQEDLRHAATFTRETKKEGERYDNVQKHLSEFDRGLTKGKFDKDKLDAAIDDLNNVLDHNTLAAGDRDALTQDLRDLRDLREHRGK